MSAMSLSQIVELADRLYPFEEAEAWDNCGIQIGDPDKIISRVAFALDPTPQTIRFAAHHSCELLITHHPVFIEPIRRITPDNLVGKTLLTAGETGVSILSLHTNLDAAPGGLNDHIAQLIGLTQVRTPEPARCARMGFLPFSMPFSLFLDVLCRKLQLQDVRLVGHPKPEVRSVFCAAGSGMGYLKEALHYRCDVIITGDVRYHAAREAQAMGIPVIDAGHFGLEKGAVSLLYRVFCSEFERMGENVLCIYCDNEQEPFATYLYEQGGLTIETTNTTP